MATPHERVRDWSERFRRAPLARRVVTGLHKRTAEIWRRTFELLQRESPEYRNSVDEEFTKESKSHCKELLQSIIAVSSGRAGRSSADPFGFVRTHAEWRARHQVPLIASLHAYRLAHKTYWGITQEALLRHAEREEALQALTMLSDFWIEFFDHVGAVLAEAHAVEERLSAAQDTRSYAALLRDLLQGSDPGSKEAQGLRTLCGLQPGQPMAVVIARTAPLGNRREADREVTLRSLVRLFQQALPSGVFGKLVAIKNNEVTAIISSDSDPARACLKVLRRHGFGQEGLEVAARVGASLDTADVASLPESLRQARLAVEFASAAQPLMQFSGIDLSDFLIRRADKAAVSLIPEWKRLLIPAGPGHTTELSRTIRAFADSSLNVKQTARRLGVHSNTVYFRLNRIKDLTGIDPRTFSGTSLLLTAIRLLENQVDGFT